MIIMKICTSVTSILIRYKKAKKAELLKAIFNQFAGLSALLNHAQGKTKGEKMEEIFKIKGEFFPCTDAVL